MKLFLIFLLLNCSFIFAQEKLVDESKFQEEKESEVIDYSNIRSVLKKDGLQKFKKLKIKKVNQLKVVRKQIQQARSMFPGENDFWSFFSKYWLAKNAAILRWDFSKPDYGIAEHLKEILEEIGLINRKIKIMVINSPTITHFGLPSNKGEYLFILSLPFMKTLDLSKEDISLLLLEDMLRIDKKMFQENLKVDLSILGKDTSKIKKREMKKWNQSLLEAYSELIFSQGFNFSQQFKITKEMDQYLKSNPALWSRYIKLLNKINKLVKENFLYKNYNKIYPSPELQIKWLSPKKKVL